MKCPKCNANHLRRSGFMCSCGYHFVFDPKDRFHMTDGKFVALINTVSANKSYCFTQNQLYARYCKVVMSKRQKAYWGCFVMALLILIVALVIGSLFPFAIFVVLAVVIGLVMRVQHSKPPTPKELNELLTKWTAGGNEITMLLKSPGLSTPPPAWQEPDIYDYGVERILYVQRDILVDLFVKNGFHAEQRALIVSMTGYPTYLKPHIKKVLQESPDLPVFLLHDSTSSGQNMIKSIKRADSSLKDHPIIDVGLFPADVKLLKTLHCVRPDRTSFGVPVDYIRYETLARALADAMNKKVTFHNLITRSGRGYNGLLVEDMDFDSDFG
ncbi:hypothetical protein ACFL27_03880 [candidate division CSSED10-310 bacterium]|uniref:Uncharacterized protein n=1 Tax=candidate division CSSED10-310 bacterium TaxID=2855610 RepID=A0ABV6YTA6_UNCC1